MEVDSQIKQLWAGHDRSKLKQFTEVKQLEVRLPDVREVDMELESEEKEKAPPEPVTQWFDYSTRRWFKRSAPVDPYHIWTPEYGQNKKLRY